MRDRLRALGQGFGASLDERSARKAEERAQLAARGEVATTFGSFPNRKCPFCGKLLKTVMGSVGKRRHAVCHHCGRNVYDFLGGVAAFIEAQRSAAMLKSQRPEATREGRVEGAAEAPSATACTDCGHEIATPRPRRCPRCGTDLA